MPDPTKKTVSASQVAALLNASPYLTGWMLWRHFKHGDETDPKENERMSWGTRLQPAILEAVAEEMSLDVTPNGADYYTHNDKIRMGATLDGAIHDLNLGPGVVECKNLDWMQWRDKWTKDDAPDHIEIQVQAQMLVTGHAWGVIAVLVGGNELRLYHRTPDLDLHKQMTAAVADFFASLDADEEPEPLGRPDELPLWRRSRNVPTEPEALDLTESRAASEMLHELSYWQGMSSQATKLVKSLKAKLEVAAGEHSPVRTWGRTAWIKRSQTRPSEVMLPMDIRQHLAGLHEILTIGEGVGELSEAHTDALGAAISWTHVTRRGGIMVKIDVKAAPTVGEPPWAGDDELTLHL